MRRPVFVDHTGRRRRAAIVLGSGLGLLLVLGLVMLSVGLVSGAPVPIPGWPDAAQVEQEVASPTVAPTRGADSPVVRRSTAAAPQPTTAPTDPPGNGNGNGNGNGHGRPTRSPGKP